MSNICIYELFLCVYDRCSDVFIGDKMTGFSPKQFILIVLFLFFSFLHLDTSLDILLIFSTVCSMDESPVKKRRNFLKNNLSV